MKTKALMILAVVMGAVFVLGSACWASGRIAHRQERQSKRIIQGARRGQITHKEFIRLNREQRRICQYRTRAFSDGHLSQRERHHLHRMQNRASKHIYGSKHNKRSHIVRKPRHKHLHFWRRPAYYDLRVRGIYTEPYWSFGWCIGWR
ncbi:MAG: hypothetical protein PVG99_13450 [Desulfobacteraceae bacterium]|jgi:hypothetical protein